ncbi:MAG TPA: chorismate lyase [Gammaproteobacteria bacterium]|nr:chorismate lyase [Gammaproteobacteria bacterium]
MMQVAQEIPALQTSKSLNSSCHWRPLDAWPVEQRPALWTWLLDTGSLTKRLRATAGPDFHVRVLHEGRTSLDLENARLLQTHTGNAALERRVYLCADTPWVYAHTLALTESRQWLDRLGTNPLGDRIFANAAAQRSVIEVAQLDSRHELYQAALQGLEMKPPVLWARRSVLLVDSQRLLIYECFLPGMGA